MSGSCGQDAEQHALQGSEFGYDIRRNGHRDIASCRKRQCSGSEGEILDGKNTVAGGNRRKYRQGVGFEPVEQRVAVGGSPFCPFAHQVQSDAVGKFADVATLDLAT